MEGDAGSCKNRGSRDKGNETAMSRSGGSFKMKKDARRSGGSTIGWLCGQTAPQPQQVRFGGSRGSIKIWGFCNCCNACPDSRTKYFRQQCCADGEHNHFGRWKRRSPHSEVTWKGMIATHDLQEGRKERFAVGKDESGESKTWTRLKQRAVLIVITGEMNNELTRTITI